MKKRIPRNVPYYSKYKVRQYTYRALCFSGECYVLAGKQEYASQTHNTLGIEKQVTKSETWCPDCEYALFWERKAI